MRKLILIAHTSLDGFVAGINGELDGFEAGEENLDFVADLTEGADTALFGRISYEMLEGYWVTAKDLPGASTATVKYSQWYSKAKKIVISKTLKSEKDRTVIISENIAEKLVQSKLEEGGNILIFGSPAIAQLLVSCKLIDEYWIFINPSIFGKGIPLFISQQQTAIALKLIGTKQFPNGELALHYIMKG